MLFMLYFLIFFGISPHFSQEGEIIAQGFGSTGDFLVEWNNSVYYRGEEHYR